MKVLVTGATGLIGSWVVRELVAAGHSPRVMVRPHSNLANLADLLGEGGSGSSRSKVDRCAGDVLDAESVRAALAGCDAVIHTAGVARFQPDDKAMMYRVNVEGVEIVLSEARRQNLQRAVLTSSMAALGGSATPRVADESTPSNAEQLGVDYNLSKWRGEQAGLRIGEAGLPLCVLRPVVAVGPGDIYLSSTATFLALARRRMPVYVDGGAAFADVRDLARAHVAALTRGSPGRIYNLGGHDLTIGALVKLVERLTGVPAPRRVPYALALCSATVAELASRALRRRSDLSRQLVKASHVYTWASSQRAQDELDYRVRPLEDSLRDTFRYFLENGRLKPTTPELRALAAG
jgi:dihydroflavonol-4-reductase